MPYCSRCSVWAPPGACCSCRCVAAHRSSGHRRSCASCSPLQLELALLAQRANSGTSPRSPRERSTRSGRASHGRSRPSLRTSSSSRSGSSNTRNALLGVVKDRGAHTFTAAVCVRGRAFALLAPQEREQRLADYGAVLAALARDGSAVRRIAWIERTLPGDGDQLGDYPLQAKRADASLHDPPEELVPTWSCSARR